MPQTVVQVPPPPPPAQAPLPPLPPEAQAAIAAGADPVDVVPSAAAVLEALQASRNELREQLSQLEDKRDDLRQELIQSREQGISFAGIEQRITELDARISSLDQQIAMADQAVAKAAAVPGAIVPEPEYHRDGPPEEVFVLGGFFIVFVLFPLSIAMARRLWKRTTTAVAAIPSDLADRMRAIEHAVESVALEVERIGEGQRFMSRVFTERTDARAVGEGAAQPVEVPARERLGERR